MKQMWLNDFKVALITKNIDNLQNLMNHFPEFKTLDELQEVSWLIDDAKKQITALKHQTLLDMKNIKQTIAFVKSTMSQNEHKLDIMQ